MSSSTWSTDELSGEGWGYVDGGVPSSSSASTSSTSLSTGPPDQREIVYEDIELNVEVGNHLR